MEKCSTSVHGENWWRKDIIGEGGFGTVYLATFKNSEGLARPYLAVKSAKYSASRSLWKEHKILEKLQSCPHVIKCFGNELTVDENGNKVYNLLLEYAFAGSLLNRMKMMRGGKLPEHEVKRHARSILLGIKSVHEIGYAHLDIKPANILLVRRSGGELEAKLCDFGLAKRLGKSQSKKGLRGTSMYLSPEAIVDSVQEGPADIWATGCVVLELLTGKSVWKRRSHWNTENFMYMIGNKFKVPEIPSGVSEEAKEFLKGCFVRNPEDRLSAEMLLRLPFVTSASVDDDQNKALVCDYVNEKESKNSIKEANYIDEEEEPSEIVGYLDDEHEEPYEVVSDKEYEEEHDPSEDINEEEEDPSEDEEEPEPYEIVCDKEYEEEDPSEDEEEPYEVVSDKEYEEERDPSEDINEEEEEPEPYGIVCDKEYEEDPSEDEEEPYEVVSDKECEEEHDPSEDINEEEEDPSEDEEEPEPYEIVCNKEYEEEDPSEDEEEPYEVVSDKEYEEEHDPSEDINEEEEDPSEDEEEPEPYEIVCDKEYEEEDPSEDEEEPYEVVSDKEYEEEHDPSEDINEEEDDPREDEEEPEPYGIVCDKEYEEDPSEDEEEPYEVVSDKECEEEHDPSEDINEEEEDPSEDEEEPEPYEIVCNKEYEEEDPSEDEEEPYEVVSDNKYEEEHGPSEDINAEEEDPSEDEEEPYEVVCDKEYEEDKEEPSVNNYEYKNEHVRLVNIDEAESYEMDPKYCYCCSEDGNEEVQSSKRRKLR